MAGVSLLRSPVITSQFTRPGEASNPTVSAFYFPNYHADPRNEEKYGREWTEGSYLEPDTVHGMAYLEAVRDVFSKAKCGATGKALATAADR